MKTIRTIIFHQVLLKIKKSTNYEKYRNKSNKKLNNFQKFKTSKSKINNFWDHSQIYSAINSAKKLNNKSINIRNNIWLESEEKSPLYIKLSKNRKVNCKNNKDRKNNII